MWRGFGVYAGVLAVIVSSATAAETTASEEWQLPVVRVVDEAGQPLPDSEAAMIRSDSPMQTFNYKKANAAGQVQFTREDYLFHESATKAPEGEFEILVLAKGKAPLVTSVTLPVTEPVTASMPEGETVTITLSGPGGASVPSSVVPRVFPQQFGVAGWPREDTPQHNSPWVVPGNDGEYNVTLQDTTAPWMLMVNEPSYLKAFSTDFSTTEALANKAVTIQLPQPGTITQALEIPAELREQASDKYFSFSPLRLVELGGESRMYMNGSEEIVLRGDQLTTVTHNNMAPGRYWVTVSEETSASVRERQELALFRDGQSATVEPGSTASVTATYKVFDPSKLKGDYAAEIAVKKLDGSPAANLPVQLRYLDRDFGYQTILKGPLSDEGTTRIPGLAGGDKTAPVFRLHEDNDSGSFIGRFQFDSSETSRSFDFQMAPNAGDPAPDVTFTDIYTSESVKLSDFRGQIVFLDFWATWCGPCQGPMEHNQKMLTKNETAWKDKVVIVGASIDEKKQTVIDHVKQKGWDKVRHLWCGEEAWSSVPAKTYGVTGVPTALLIDQEGKVVWRGHPAGCDLEAEVSKLLK